MIRTTLLSCVSCTDTCDICNEALFCTNYNIRTDNNEDEADNIDTSKELEKLK